MRVLLLAGCALAASPSFDILVGPTLHDFPPSTSSEGLATTRLTLGARRLDNVVGENNDFNIMQPSMPMGCQSDFCTIKGTYTAGEALFGVPPYGGAKRIVGNLHYVTPDASDNGCLSNYSTDMISGTQPSIFLVDRGDCHFVDKVRIGELKGAAAVVIADNDCMCNDLARGGKFASVCNNAIAKADGMCSMSMPFMGDDGSGGDINIPSFIITLWDAQRIKDCYLTASGAVKASDSVTGIVCPVGQEIIVSLQWDMPNPDGNVEWEIWTNSDDSDVFKSKFKNYARTLAPQTTFTPHYFIWDGAEWGCFTVDELCSTQCTHGGRYCSIDPDQSLRDGVSGADVVMENLRQLCVWKSQANSTVKTDGGAKWWDYVNEFAQECHGKDIVNPATFNEECSKKVHAKVGLDWEKTKQCMHDSEMPDGSNSILANELHSREEKVIFNLPTVVVNNVIERGGVNAMAVLSTICSGFQEGSTPEVCSCIETHSEEERSKCLCAVEGLCDDGSNGNNDENGGGVAVGVVVLIVLVVVGALSGVGIVYWRREKAQMRKEVRNILAEYMPLEEIPADPTKSGGFKSSNGTSGSNDNGGVVGMI